MVSHPKHPRGAGPLCRVHDSRSDAHGLQVRRVRLLFGAGGHHSRERSIMCGRYGLATSPTTISRVFGLIFTPKLADRYNICPSQSVPVVRQTTAGRELVMLRWGLIPRWSRDGKGFNYTRAETAASKPAFGEAFRKRRCLIPATGFYEWAKTSDGKKQPYYFHLRDGSTFAFAGLWERWESAEQKIVESCALITTAANELVRKYHDRMPVILAPTDFDAWLDSRNPHPETLLKPYPVDAMEAYPVSKLVNKPESEGPVCIQPAVQASDAPMLFRNLD